MSSIHYDDHILSCMVQYVVILQFLNILFMHMYRNILGQWANVAIGLKYLKVHGNLYLKKMENALNKFDLRRN